MVVLSVVWPTLQSKYGLVPKSVKPETYTSNNTTKMSRLICSKLREYGLDLRKMVDQGKKSGAINAQENENAWLQVYRMLTLTLGEPVKELLPMSSVIRMVSCWRS